MTVVSTAVSIYTRRHVDGDYARYNAYMVLPSRKAQDLTYLGQGWLNVRIRFNKLEAL